MSSVELTIVPTPSRRAVSSVAQVSSRNVGWSRRVPRNRRGSLEERSPSYGGPTVRILLPPAASHVRTWLFLASGVSLARRRDHEGEILEVLVQRRRDRRAAVKLGRNRSGRVGQVYTILADALEPAPAERERRS